MNGTPAPFPILMYHGLWAGGGDEANLQAQWAADPQLRDPGARLYALDHREFERQMTLLAQHGRVGMDWSELDAPRPAVPWITFDDGHRSNHALALPILLRLGLRGVFFITTDWIGTEGFMNEAQIRELRSAGMLIGSHGCSHRYLSDLSATEVEQEMAQSKARLEAILGEPVESIALPGGRNHPAVRAAARRLGYRHVFTSRMGLAAPEGDPLDWPRIAITHRLPPSFLTQILNGDSTMVRAMARKSQMRHWARQLLGNALYDRLRGWVIGRR